MTISGLFTVNEDRIPARGARIARRDDRGYREHREYLREEQRREAGRPARKSALISVNRPLGRRQRRAGHDETQWLQSPLSFECRFRVRQETRNRDPWVLSGPGRLSRRTQFVLPFRSVGQQLFRFVRELG